MVVLPVGVPFVLLVMFCSVSIASVQSVPYVGHESIRFYSCEHFIVIDFFTSVEGRGSAVVPEVTGFDTQVICSRF